MGIADFLFGKTSAAKTSQVDNLTPEQKQLMTYGTNQAMNQRSSYQGAAPDYFQQQYQNPMMQQYQSTIAGLQASPERHSSSRRNQEYGAQRNFMTSLGQAKAGFMDQERIRQIQAAEAAKQRQMGYLQNVLGTKGFDTMVTPGQQKQGFLGQLGQVASTVGSLASLAKGGQSAGLWGQGTPQSSMGGPGADIDAIGRRNTATGNWG